MSGKALRWTGWVSAPLVVVLAGAVVTGYLGPVVAAVIAVSGILPIALLAQSRTRLKFALNDQVRRVRERLQDSDSEEARRAAIIERMIDSLPDPLIFISDNQRIIRANNAAMGLSSAAKAGRHISEMFRQPAVLNGIEAALKDGVAQMVEITLPAPVEQSFMVRLMPIQQSEGTRQNGSSLLLAMQDVTKSQRSERMRADFVANVSHELRTPLTSLIGFIETLRGPAKDDADARDQFLAIMHDQSERMLRIIEDLLSLSRIELDEHTRPSEEVSLPDVLGKVRNVLSLKAQDREMALQFSMPEGAPTVTGDSDQLIQVFQNLIDNAIKYGRPGTPVEVGLELKGNDRLNVTVRDHGQGISKAHLPRLTERFYRVDSARSREMGGTGLGLAIVKHIVNRHRGRLNVDSREGEGTCFTVSLPASQKSVATSSNTVKKAV